MIFMQPKRETRKGSFSHVILKLNKSGFGIKRTMSKYDEYTAFIIFLKIVVVVVHEYRK